MTHSPYIPPPSHSTAAVLVTGGLDSTTLAWWLSVNGCGVQPVFLDYGQHTARTELSTIQEVMPQDVEAVRVLDLRDIFAGSNSRLIDPPNLWHDRVTSDDLHLPYRNLVILAIGAAFAATQQQPALYAAFIASNTAKEVDASTSFIREMSRLTGDMGAVALETPFRSLSKTEVVDLGLSLGVPIGRTYSCQVSPRVPCGACPNCVDRRTALAQR